MIKSDLISTFENPYIEQKSWSPYQNNGGTALGIAGEDFSIIASDTRLSLGYSVLSRNTVKQIQLTDKAVLATSGMRADQVTLHKILDIRIRQYYQTHRRQISTPSIAQMLSNTLYYKRFFPYYTFNVLGGIDEEGKGCVYGYDAIGSFQRYPVACSGTANALIQPILDNQIEREHQLGQKPWFDITQDEALKLVQDAFTSAGERDIYTGDSVYISIIDKNGVKNITFELKED